MLCEIKSDDPDIIYSVKMKCYQGYFSGMSPTNRVVKWLQSENYTLHWQKSRIIREGLVHWLRKENRKTGNGRHIERALKTKIYNIELYLKKFKV